MFAEVTTPVDWVDGLRPRAAVEFGSQVLAAAREEVDLPIAESPLIQPLPEGVTRWREAYLTSSMEWDEYTNDSSSLLEIVLGHLDDDQIPQLDIKSIIADEVEVEHFRELVLAGVEELIDRRHIHKTDELLNTYYRLLKNKAIKGSEKALQLGDEEWVLESNKDIRAPNYQWDVGMITSAQDKRMIHMIDTLKLARARLHEVIDINMVEEMIDDSDTSVFDAWAAYKLLSSYSVVELQRNSGFIELMKERKTKLTKRFIKECKQDLSVLKRSNSEDPADEYMHRAQVLRRKITAADMLTKKMKRSSRHKLHPEWTKHPAVESIEESFNDLLTDTESTDLLRLIIR